MAEEMAVVAMGTEAEPEEMPEYEPGTAADKVEVAMGKEAAARRLAAAARGSSGGGELGGDQVAGAPCL